jgi:3D (Asp-Asp-Asp) domain-containing protein
MRIISAFTALRIAIALLLVPMFVPTMALAAEAVESNETQTNLKTQNNLLINNIISGDENVTLLAYAPENFEGYFVPAKTEEELAREAVLAKYENRRKAAVLPEGKFTINASAYTAAADECGKSDGITASGLMVKEKETIACPPQFPFGIKLKIEGMGTYVCQDRGGAIKVNHIDIYMKTKTQAFAFGRKNLMAEVVR